jgi:hypothetical protein
VHPLFFIFQGIFFMSDTPANTISIDGVQYNLNDLSDVAKAQITNLRVTEQEIARLQMQLAITQTAKVAYARALKGELPKH